MARHCSSCGVYQTSSSFSRNQWAKGIGVSRCMSCVNGGSQHQPTYHTTGYAVPTIPPASVPTYQTGYMGFAVVTYQCTECHREFNSQNELNMHMQVHRPREFRCPVCGDVRFRSPANAVQHIESGYCRGCLGKDNARRQIYEHVQRNAGGSNPMLTNGGGHPYGGSVPDFPYQCQQCTKSFRQLSQLMQHMDQKHNRMRMLGY